MRNNEKPSLPKWPFRFLQLICPDHLYEEIEGDLIQNYERDIKTINERKAKLRLIWSAIRFLRLGIVLRIKFSLHMINSVMIGNYFKVATRNILKRKVYSFINAFGLSIGMA